MKKIKRGTRDGDSEIATANMIADIGKLFVNAANPALLNSFSTIQRNADKGFIRLHILLNEQCILNLKLNRPRILNLKLNKSRIFFELVGINRAPYSEPTLNQIRLAVYFSLLVGPNKSLHILNS